MVYNGLSYYSANLNVSSHLGFFIRQVSIILISTKHPYIDKHDNQAKIQEYEHNINLGTERLKLFT